MQMYAQTRVGGTKERTQWLCERLHSHLLVKNDTITTRWKHVSPATEYPLLLVFLKQHHSIPHPIHGNLKSDIVYDLLILDLTDVT